MIQAGSTMIQPGFGLKQAQTVNSTKTGGSFAIQGRSRPIENPVYQIVSLLAHWLQHRVDMNATNTTPVSLLGNAEIRLFEGCSWAEMVAYVVKSEEMAWQAEQGEVAPESVASTVRPGAR